MAAGASATGDVKSRLFVLHAALTIRCDVSLWAILHAPLGNWRESEVCSGVACGVTWQRALEVCSVPPFLYCTNVHGKSLVQILCFLLI